VKSEFLVRDLVGIMGRFGFAERKAAEGSRTPKRWRVDRKLPNRAKRLGVRLPSAALGGRATAKKREVI